MQTSRYADSNGIRQEFFTDGKLSAEGPVEGGKRHGKWKYFFRNGLPRAAGNFVDGEMDGYWWREEGSLWQTGYFKRNVQTGAWKRYHPNGQLSDEGDFVNGNKAGEWTTYDPDGNVKRKKVYKPKV